MGKDVKLTDRQKSLLSGEALFNDASGVVSFQFAIAAAITGSFSLANAAQSFAISFFGGIAVGLVVGLLAVLALGAIRSYGYESITVHVVFEVLFPLLVPPTEPVEPLLQVQVHVQRFELFELLVPPTEPEFRQQGLQQELATKLGNTMPP